MKLASILISLLGIAAVDQNATAPVVASNTTNVTFKGSDAVCNTLTTCHTCALAGCDYDATTSTCGGAGQKVRGETPSKKFFEEAAKCTDTGKFCKYAKKDGVETMSFDTTNSKKIPAGYFCLWNSVDVNGTKYFEQKAALSTSESMEMYLYHNKTEDNGVSYKMANDYYNNVALTAMVNPYTGAIPINGLKWTTAVINTVERKASDATDFSITQEEISLDWYRNQQKPLWAVIMIFSFWTVIICGGSIAIIRMKYFGKGGDDGHGHAHEGGSKDDFFRQI
mgnify:CR=1 FL=1|jgi:hypothetical protein